MRYQIFTTTLLTLALALGATAAGAQDSTRALMAEQLEDYRAALELSDYQWTQVELILKSGIRERIAIARRYGLDDTEALASLDRKQRRAMQRDLKDARKFTRDRMKRYLDKEQFKRFEAYQDDIYEAIDARIDSASG